MLQAITVEPEQLMFLQLKYGFGVDWRVLWSLMAVALVQLGVACERRSGHQSSGRDAGVDAQVVMSDSGSPRDSGDSHPSDPQKTDGGGSTMDAGRCMREGSICPAGCVPLFASRYDEQRQCLSSESFAVGCIAPPYLSDPRCLVNVVSGNIYQVELSFVETYKEMGLGDDWEACSREDNGAVSSTITPFCDAQSIDDDGGR
jgi:hypothetical protein